MAYIPPHKRHSKGLPLPEPTPALETHLLPSFRKKVNLNSFGGDQQKRKEKNFPRKNVAYTDDAVVKWFTVGLADHSPFSSLLRLHPVSLESFEQKSRQKPLSLLLPEGCSEGTNELIDKPWLFVAENVKQDLFLSFQHMKREMEETDMAEVKPSVVARFGKVLFYGNSSICQESLKTNPLSETTLRKMKRFFHTDVPPANMDYMENQVAEKLGLEYVQGKELYCVKLSDELRPESTVSCKCTVAKDHKKIQHYKIELNRVRHMVADMSCLGKSSDLRLILYTKKINIALSKQTIDENLVFEMLVDNLKLIWDHCLLDGSSS
ncbi:uncharacterized protein LOC107801463 isoform X2 [Nicotiana tabacum]|uniref:Uncharacterized protein LOC107801463 isoform X2 n=2 Tax=Nicotiana TaxID=4085 RepID=A0A1S4AUB5_TOBAC|nr:PREDICTED: uncharacterized protein LOC104226892 isoform X2 [Nicotiana sylvestris]XP_016480279.1 PREDICTED: uncharacterized protein LOC107801463 isoform X2 [Nicotiana tabacum]